MDGCVWVCGCGCVWVGVGILGVFVSGVETVLQLLCLCRSCQNQLTERRKVFLSTNWGRRCTKLCLE